MVSLLQLGAGHDAVVTIAADTGRIPTALVLGAKMGVTF
jgi:hypothetical protein